MKKKILYISDNINFVNGVQTVTKLQIEQLHEFYEIDIFSLIKPNENTKDKFEGTRIIGEEVWQMMAVFDDSFFSIMKSSQYSLKQKLKRVIYVVSKRLKINNDFVENSVEKAMKNQFDTYDIVVVLSEASKIRRFVSSLNNIYKIQWIHTSYKDWSQLNDWTKSVTAQDREIYSSYDKIVTISNKNKLAFIKIFPEFASKTIAIWNMIPTDDILEKAKQPLMIKTDKKKTKLVTISRLERMKSLDRVIEVTTKLYQENYLFDWYIVGGGEYKIELEKKISINKIDNQVILLDHLDNPYPLLKNCDFLVLPSQYEGMPVVIHESMLLHVPVLATNVGGVSEQIENNYNGVIVDNNIKSLYLGVKELLDHSELIKKYKKNLEEYRYNNTEIITQLRELFDIDEGDKK